MTSIPLGPHGLLPFNEVVVGDTESTGLAPWGVRDSQVSGDPHGFDRLCSAAFVEMRRREGRWVRGDRFALSCNPGRPVPEEAARVNGFAWSGDGTPVPAGRVDLAYASRFDDVRAESLARFVRGRPLVFHNAVFDASLLDAELERIGQPPLQVPVLCTKAAFADMLGLGRPEHYIPGTSLNTLCDRLGVSRTPRRCLDGTEMHGATVDAELAAACFSVQEPMGWMRAAYPASLPHRRLDTPAGTIRLAIQELSALLGSRYEARQVLWTEHKQLEGRRPIDVASHGLEGVAEVMRSFVGKAAMRTAAPA